MNRIWLEHQPRIKNASREPLTSTQSGLNINLTLMNAELSLEFLESTERLLETSLL